MRAFLLHCSIAALGVLALPALHAQTAFELRDGDRVIVVGAGNKGGGRSGGGAGRQGQGPGGAQAPGGAGSD